MTVATLKVNGRVSVVSAEPRQHLADYLREDLRLTGTHLGCEHGVCGACTVEIDGAPARACIAFPAMLDGAEIHTIEGFDDDALMGELRSAFSAEHALQCGFCTPGMLIAARDAVKRAPGPDETWIRREMAGNLCRCTGYVGIVRAIARVIAARASIGNPAVPAVAGPVELRRFESDVAAPIETVATLIASQDGAASPGPGWSRIEESFVVRRPPQVVWAVLADFPLIARCFPGASLVDHASDRLVGQIEARLGPMRATFRGAATIVRDDARLTGTLIGGGQDRLSGSRTRAEVTYVLLPDGKAGTRVNIRVAYRLSGPLAQFSRGGIVRNLAGAIVLEFATRLNSILADPDASAATPQPSALRFTLRALIGMLKQRWK